MQIEFDNDDDESFYVMCKNKHGEYAGKIKIQIDVVPMEKAKNNPVGQGRADPNHSPFLPPPIGRLQWSLNPFKMLNQCVGRSLRVKIYALCIVIVCLAVCISAFPIIVGDLIAYFLNPEHW